MSKNESISQEDMSLLFVTDSLKDLIKLLHKRVIKKFGFKKQDYNLKKYFR